ncbi:MAG TPA: hypothetical protein PLP17_06350 [Oligoflexia bacterium]|nr:hypothetical protein [Oligoflexia bacterium]
MDRWQRSVTFVGGCLFAPAKPVILLLLCSFAGAVQSSAAQPLCRDGKPLARLLNSADAVAIIENAPDIRLPVVRIRGRNVFYARFVEFIKPPLVADFDRRNPLEIVIDVPIPMPLIGTRRYLAFLTYLGRNSWQVSRCELLQILPRDKVENACKAIADLFGENPYIRERKCLLNYPPDAELGEVKVEIIKGLRDNATFSGRARFLQNGLWIPEISHQLIVFELESRARKEFLGSEKNIDPFPIKAYIQSSDLSRSKFERHVRVGVRFDFSGRWQKGSFIIDSIEWISGRRQH